MSTYCGCEFPTFQPGLTAFSAEWWAAHNAHHLATFPDTDAITRANLDTLLALATPTPDSAAPQPVHGVGIGGAGSSAAVVRGKHGSPKPAIHGEQALSPTTSSEGVPSRAMSGHGEPSSGLASRGVDLQDSHRAGVVTPGSTVTGRPHRPTGA